MSPACFEIMLGACLSLAAPVIVGHRGTGPSGPHNPYPENSLPAIRRAFVEGADLVEIDVRLDACGVPILWHDKDVEINGRKVPVRSVSRQQMPPLVGATGLRTCVPTLCQAVELALQCGCCHKVLIVELKTDDDSCQRRRLVCAVLKVLRNHDALDRVMVASADPEAVKMVDRQAPGVTTGFFAQLPGQAWPTVWEMLGPEPTNIEWILLRQRFGLSAFSQQRLLRRAQDKGIGVAVWTVDRSLVMRYFDFRGFDMLITNQPDVARETFD